MSDTETLNRAFQEFRRAVWDHFSNVNDDGEKQAMVDRIFAALAALVGAVLLAMPGKWRKDGAAGALLAAAIRLWSRERKDTP